MRSKRGKGERGFVFVGTGVSLFIIVTFFALVVDLGHIFVTKSELQNAADAAALAAAVDLPWSQNTARQAALDFAQSHWAVDSNIKLAPEDIQFGNFNTSTSQLQMGVGPVNGIQVKARRVTGAPSGPLPLFFAKLFGKNTSNVQASSRSYLDQHVVGVTGKNRLIPYSVINFVVDQDRNGQYDLGSIVNIHARSDAPGNFGFLDLDGGSNDVPELRRYLEEGYDHDFVIPPGGSVPVLGSTGIDGNSLLNSFQQIIDDVVFLPVHNRVDYQGSNAVFNVVGILAVKVLKVKLTGTLNSRYIRVQIIYFASSALVVNSAAPINNSLAKPRLVG